MTLCKIDGMTFDTLVTAIEETSEIIEGENSGIAIYRQREIRDIKGVKIGHTITFAPDNNPAEFDRLYDYLFKTVRPYVTIETVHNQNTISYEAAYNTCSRSVSHIDEQTDTIYWNELTVAFRPMENQIDAG